jgi:hypothetical protein
VREIDSCKAARQARAGPAAVGAGLRAAPAALRGRLAAAVGALLAGRRTSGRLAWAWRGRAWRPTLSSSAVSGALRGWPMAGRQAAPDETS